MRGETTSAILAHKAQSLRNVWRIVTRRVRLIMFRMFARLVLIRMNLPAKVRLHAWEWIEGLLLVGNSVGVLLTKCLTHRLAWD